MPEKLSLSELQSIIRDSLYIAFPDTFWIVAEISEIKENYAGHCYLELIEKQKEGNNIKARVRAIIWCKKYVILKSFFQNTTGQMLTCGLKILVKARVEYHELYGLSLDILDIDPAYTVGELSAKRQMIIRQLEDEGVFEMNRQMELPAVIRKIAIVSSRNAAGYTDFMNHLTNNNYNYIFYTTLFESPMQGPETETGIVKALDRIVENIELFDVAVIIRGGGSQVDLSWFDNYNIAFHITQFPIPVITGIGHDKDMSVADMVAFESLKTPTAVADFIIDHNTFFENNLDDLWSRIKKSSLDVVEKNKTIVDSYGLRLFPLTKNLVLKINEKLSDKIIRLVKTGSQFVNKTVIDIAGQQSRINSATRSCLTRKDDQISSLKNLLKPMAINYLSSASLKIATYQKTLEILKPDNVLKRGYTITSKNGLIIKSSKLIRQGDVITTQFSDGVLSSTVDKNIEDAQTTK